MWAIRKHLYLNLGNFSLNLVVNIFGWQICHVPKKGRGRQKGNTD